MKLCGIYKIENLINHKVYIGSSSNISKRWNEHKRKLRNNAHHNQNLQASYNKYGPENFQYSILEECLEANLIEREQYWLDFFRMITLVYNKSLYIELPMRGSYGIKNPFYGHKHSKESLNKMSLSKLGNKFNKGNHHKAETILKLKRPKTQEEKIKMSLAKKGKSGKSGKNAPYYGKKHSQETIEKLRIINLGLNNHNYGKHPKKYECLHCKGLYSLSNLNHWHNNKCKSLVGV